MKTIYAAIGMHVEAEGPKTPTVKYFEDQNQAERQYHLFCAAAAISEYPTDTAILMTAEGFVLESKTWKHEAQPAPEPEPEEPAEAEGE